MELGSTLKKELLNVLKTVDTLRHLRNEGTLTTCSYLNSRGVATDYVEDYLGVVSAILGERR